MTSTAGQGHTGVSRASGGQRADFTPIGIQPARVPILPTSTTDLGRGATLGPPPRARWQRPRARLRRPTGARPTQSWKSKIHHQGESTGLARGSHFTYRARLRMPRAGPCQRPTGARPPRSGKSTGPPSGKSTGHSPGLAGRPGKGESRGLARGGQTHRARLRRPRARVHIQRVHHKRLLGAGPTAVIGISAPAAAATVTGTETGGEWNSQQLLDK